MRVLSLEKLFKGDFMKLILCVVLIIAVVCYLTVLIMRQENNLKQRLEQLESENIEENKRLIVLEKRVKKLEIGIINEERDSCRENKTSYKTIRRNR